MLDGLLGMDYDFIDLYVWVEVYLLGVGWIGFDLMFGLLIGESYILLVVILYYINVVLIVGMVSKVEVEFDFYMEVVWVVEYLCIIKLFFEDFWFVLNKMGEVVDKLLID